MNIFSILQHRIFLRIYAGLLLVCLLSAWASKSLLDVINEERAQNYREEVATGVFHLAADEYAERTVGEQRENWLADTSASFGSVFRVVALHEIDFTHGEKKRLNKELSVVRYSVQQNTAYIYQKIPNENNVLTVKVDEVNEQKVRAVGIFLLDALYGYDSLTEHQQKLKELSEKFPFPIRYQNIDDVNLDNEQKARLQRDDLVILVHDSSVDTALDIILKSEVSDVVIEMGPVPLFNPYPRSLVWSLIGLGVLLISLGVYGLIFPLERKLLLLQSGLDDISKGKLDTRLMVKGQDETARLSATFNTMAAHIKRLIDSQRELTRAVSHELRTPVARIRFAVDMLADTDDIESRQQQRDFIDEDIEALNSLIDEILTYAKLEEGSPKMNWELVNLRELIEQIERETNGLGKAIKIIVNLPSPKAMVEADRRYLHRVVQNLAGNALRHANSKIIITANIRRGNAYVSVEDDGQGIPPEDRNKVFIPFARLDDSRTRSSGGYGLGLSIVSRICFWFNGEMSVDESPSLGGARFTMKWPIKQLAQAIAADELTQEHNERKVILEG